MADIVRTIDTDRGPLLVTVQRMSDRGITLYLAGPMSGLPQFNFPAFHAAAARLRDRGYTVINPAELEDGDTSKPWTHYMRRDIAMLVTADAVAVLPGWERSRGASLEVHIARELGMPIIDAETEQPIDRDSILHEAHRLVHGDRGADYGHPYEDFSRTARIWSAILGVEVTPAKVALCMIGLKISRECHKPKRDNRVDIAGYAETLQMVMERVEAEAAAGRVER